jgi:lipoprotein-releasing system ATP-binding protein
MSEVLRLEGLDKAYNRGQPGEVRVLRGAALALARGEVVALVAPSGAGKSTLLHIAGLLDTADAGRVLLGGREMGGLSDRARTAARRAEIGFIYQFHHLLPEFSALENIDPATSDQVFDVLIDLVRSTGLAALIATHNPALAARMDRTVRLEAGRLV